MFQVSKQIGQAVQDLIELIETEKEDENDGRPYFNGPIREINIQLEPKETHWCISALLGPPEYLYAYHYAIYVDAETGKAEVDGY